MSEVSLGEDLPTAPEDSRDSDPIAVLFQQTFRDDHDLDGDAMDARILQDLFALEVAAPKIGRFEIRERLGGGGMGEVYSAWDPELRRMVAIKLTRRRRSASPEEILREARALASVDGSHVIPVYDVGVHGDRAYLAMKNIEGQTLAQWQRERRSLSDIVGVYAQAAKGLAEMHRAGVVHCDFKPDNVLVDAQGWVWVSDFGLARLGHDGGAEAGHVGGTLGYMAPEQLFDGIGSPASDQFSFCVALFNAVYGTSPFPGKGEALAQRLARCEIVFPIRPLDVPRWLVRLLERGLHREPSKRYPTMDALLADLARDRRKPARIATVVGSITVAAAALVMAIIPADPPLSDPLAYTWGPDQEVQLREHFDSFDLPWITVSGTTIIGAIDDWADSFRSEWQFALTDGETITHDAELVYCLANQRAYVRSFIDQLGNADVQSLADAPKLASELPDPAFCRHLVASQPPSLDPEVMSARRGALARASALRRVRDFEGSRMILDELLILARAEVWPALEIDVLHERGLMWFESGQSAAALEDLQTAMRVAIEYGEFGRTAQLAVDRVWVANPQVPRDLRLEWMEQAEAYQSHLHIPSLANRLAVVRALNALDAGDSTLAEAWMLDHLDALEQRSELGTFHEIECLHVLALALDAQGPSRAAEAEGMFVRAIERAQIVYGPNHPQLAKLLNDAGFHAAYNGDLKSARARMTQALELRRATLPPDHPHLLRSYVAIAGLHLQLGNLEDAQSIALATLQHGLEPDRVYEVYEILGHIAVHQERWRDAVTWYQKALFACPSDLVVETLELQIDFAMALAEAGDYQAATEWFDRYLPAFEATFELPAQGEMLCPVWTVRIRALDDERAERELRRVLELLGGTTKCEIHL
jgi:tetratricopeptide (TPR) repeat protein/predicted Ser/Thr protein kinase